MEKYQMEAIEKCGKGSLSGETIFPEVVALLREAGVESYLVDLRRREKTYYLPSGETFSELEDLPVGPIDRELSHDGVRSALKAVQHKEIDYREFLRQIMRAGIAGYNAYIDGRKVVYVGRNGDEYVEPFPEWL